MNDNIQEYSSAVGTGKTSKFIPHQMFINRDQFSQFYLVGVGTKTIEESYHQISRKMLGFSYDISKRMGTSIYHFDLQPYLKGDKSDLENDLRYFLARAGQKSNVIVDDVNQIYSMYGGIYLTLHVLSDRVGMVTMVSNTFIRANKYIGIEN
jgi:hypothetical protein